jgi:CHASE2 domain-containing sensor protein/nitrogen-specific signal transduction histidine kinase
MQSGEPRTGKNRSQIRRWLFLNAVLLAFVGVLSLSYPMEELSRRISDLNFRLRGTQGTSRDVALVLIDDASLNRYGRWPWRRSMLARVVRAAAAERPKALGLDILLSETEDESDDREFADALKAAGNVILVSKISNSQRGRLWVEPLPLFSREAIATGHAQALLGPDSICRSIPVQELTLEGPRWAFALEIARAARGASLEDDGQYLRIGEIRIPTIGATARSGVPGVESESPRFLAINYRGQIETGGSPAPFPVVSAADLLEGKARGQLHGKAVLIGYGSAEIADRVPTPVSGRIPMPGVEIHANLVDTILAGRGLRPLGGTLQIILVLGFALISTWMVLRWPGWRGLLSLMGLIAGSYAASYLLFAWAHRLIEFGPFLCAGVLAGPMAQLHNLITVDRSVTRGLRQLQLALRKTGSAEVAASVSTALRAGMKQPIGNLHWKISLLQELQTELSSVYAFDETLLNAMQEGLAVFASDDRLVFCNPRWQELCSRQNWNPAASLSEFASALNETIRGKLYESLMQPGGHFDSEVHWGEGLFQLRAMKLPSSSQTNSSGLTLLVLTDLTARLERDRARAEALSFVTHELRTPLVSIQGFAEYLLRYPQQAASTEAAATIFRESGRLVAMINTYLDVLRLEAGSRPLRRENFNIRDTVNQAKQVLQSLAQASKITVTTEVAADVPSLEGDPHLIGGALLNLLSNAVKYTPQGREIKLRVAVEGNMVVVEVRNPGPVIPPQELARLFEPFYRGREQEDATPGWGLGLAFVKRIAEQHGGKVGATSEPESGTCFRVLLPASGFYSVRNHNETCLR